MKKKKHFILLLNKMCMNLQNSHPFPESAEGIAVHNHRAVLQVPSQSRSSGLPWGLVTQGVVPSSAWGPWWICVSNQIRNIFKEQMPSSGSLKCGSQLRNQSIPLYCGKKLLSGVSVVSDALSAKAKRTALLSAFSSQKRVAFVLINNLYSGTSANI